MWQVSQATALTWSSRCRLSMPATPCGVSPWHFSQRTRPSTAGALIDIPAIRCSAVAWQSWQRIFSVPMCMSKSAGGSARIGSRSPCLVYEVAAAGEVARAARLPRRPPHLPRNGGQVERRVGQAAAARHLPVRAGRVVADQAVDVGRVGEIELRVHPAVADVAGGALLQVRTDRDAGVVDHHGQADVDPVLVPLQGGRAALPVPVGRPQHVLPDLRDGRSGSCG